MIVGNKERFAIEFELDPVKLADPEMRDWLFGRIRFWCCGQQVGRYEDDTTLRDVAIEAERFLTYEGRRTDSTLLSSAPDTVIRAIDNGIFTDTGQSDEQVRANAERFNRFLVSPETAEFDPWRILLIEGERDGRLIWFRKGEEKPHECALARGELDGVFRSFLMALRREHQDQATSNR